jgi:DNA-binding NarL/FixJ family response regulator
VSDAAPRVVIADDQTLVRGGFRLILGSAGIPVAAEAADGREAVAAVLKHQPDVVLMDIRMPEIAAVRLVRRGDALLAPSITRRLVERFAPRSAAADLSVLTPRELEVLGLIARGLSNAELAAALTLSEATVKTHVARILGKLGLRDRVQAVVLAYETGLVSAGQPRA